MCDTFNGNDGAVLIKDGQFFDLESVNAAVPVVYFDFIGGLFDTLDAQVGMSDDLSVNGVVSEVLGVMCEEFFRRVSEHICSGGTDIGEHSVGAMLVEEVLFTEVFDESTVFLLAFDEGFFDVVSLRHFVFEIVLGSELFGGIFTSTFVALPNELNIYR